jgi:hypothetical protein
MAFSNGSDLLEKSILFHTRDRQRRAPVPNHCPLIICAGLQRRFDARCPGAENLFHDCAIGPVAARPSLLRWPCAGTALPSLVRQKT